MSALLSRRPYAAREDAALLEEMNRLTRHHLGGCPAYARVWPDWRPAGSFADLPYLHVGAFKHVVFKTEAEGVKHERILKSSATTSGISSQVALDRQSSEWQGASSLAILKDFAGEALRPLLVLDSARSLRMRGEVGARVAAAMSLRPLASEIAFLLDDANDAESFKSDSLAAAARRSDDLLVYGFTWILWLTFGSNPELRALLRGKRVRFVHSGGWKKLEAIRVDREAFDAALLDGLAPGSSVIDFYGLAEQVGVIYPLCGHGFRHAPLWAEVIVREPASLAPLERDAGQLQLMNPLAIGAPYHNVLTEDLGRLVPGDCACGRRGRRFELLGRIPKAEVRGCANV